MKKQAITKFLVENILGWEAIGKYYNDPVDAKRVGEELSLLPIHEADFIKIMIEYFRSWRRKNV